MLYIVKESFSVHLQLGTNHFQKDWKVCFYQLKFHSHTPTHHHTNKVPFTVQRRTQTELFLTGESTFNHFFLIIFGQISQRTLGTPNVGYKCRHLHVYTMNFCITAYLISFYSMLRIEFELSQCNDVITRKCIHKNNTNSFCKEI